MVEEKQKLNFGNGPISLYSKIRNKNKVWSEFSKSYESANAVELPKMTALDDLHGEAARGAAVGQP